MTPELPVLAATVSFYRVPTESFGRHMPESDGTAQWDSTGVLVIELTAGDTVGLGYSYTSPAAAVIAQDTLIPQVIGSNALDSEATFWTLARSVRNLGWPGICACAISAIDIALADLKAKILDISLVQLLGGDQPGVLAYGSGGFTNYSIPELQQQLSGWVDQGMSAVKMKIGTHPDEDLNRVRAARKAIGTDIQLFVDANGAYSRKQALGFAHEFAELGVSWFEEPVSSDDLEGLRLIRNRAPGGMQIAAGEYGYTPSYFHAMLAAEAVDTIQADATRCGGVTGFLYAAAAAQTSMIPISAHTAPALHASIGSARPNVVNVEYFHDHARIEKMFFDGIPTLRGGHLMPDRQAAGHGLVLKPANAAPYLISSADSDGKT